MCFNPLLASALFHVISKPDSELNPIKVVFSFLSAAETRKVFICEKKKSHLCSALCKEMLIKAASADQKTRFPTSANI